MRLIAITVASALAVTATPALAANAAPVAAPAPVTVARYNFDAGTATASRIVDTSGRGTSLTIRTADSGKVAFSGTTDKYASFPVACAETATVCPRAILEGTDDADLDPGTQRFRWGASVRVAMAQVTGSTNVVQKGVSDTESLWKMQVGGNHGKASCVASGQGVSQVYLVRSSVSVADNAWHDIMCQRSGAALSIYVDGTERGTTAIPATLSIANSMPLRIGGPNLNIKSDLYHGALDDVYARLG
ncbi:LamG-like jellyroll fold domain-containing protein [Actinoplanes sp. NPDC026623]|uniref:LamG-like jellyroll fold domain-containing protein n=1 Tax=Actinoplanes sp. NPDC026623 TaxID=3155610 RepID=UPI0033FE404B